MTKERGPKFGGLPESVYDAHREYWEHHLARPGDAYDDYLASRGWHAGWWAWWEEDEFERVWLRRLAKQEVRWRYLQREKGDPEVVDAVEFLTEVTWSATPAHYLAYASFERRGLVEFPDFDLAAGPQLFGLIEGLDYESLVGAEM